MCLGVPMQVIDCADHTARCRNGDVVEVVDISLVGPQPSDTWLLVFLGAARQVLDPQEALEIGDALRAVSAVMNGEPDAVDEFFSDLIDREPQLPEHLRQQMNGTE